MFGGSGDIIAKSEAYRCCGEFRYQIGIISTLLCNRKDRNIKFWWSEENIEPMPAFDEKLEEGGPWKFIELSVSDVGLAIYPMTSHDFVVTKKIQMGNDFAVCQICPSEGGFSNYKKFLADGQNMKKGLDDSEFGQTRILRSFRIELADPKWKEKDSPVALDGSVFTGSKFQGHFDQDVVRQCF